METREVIVGIHDDAGRPRPLRNTINGSLPLEHVAGINEYESFAVGFDDKVMNEVGIVDEGGFKEEFMMALLR
jgi:hypothetical protein